MIDVRDIRFAYPDADAESLSGVDLEIDRGGAVALLGHNGAGKTTLLKLVAGLLEPDAGAVRVGGSAAADAVVGFAPENPRTALFAKTVADEVAFFPENRGLDAERRAERAMEALDVAALSDRNPAALSTGEQRRVSIAAVLAGDPDVVALDEPTAGLDVPATRHLGELLADLDATVVFSTHAAEFAFAFADDAALLTDGRLAGRGDPRTVLADESLCDRAGIRPPGAVEWARRHGVDRVPDSPAAAAAMLEAER